MPVFNSTKAIEDMQQRDGSRARKPHSSSRLNPLKFLVSMLHRIHLMTSKYTPHAQHVNKMLLGDIIFLVHVPLKRGEDILFIHKVIPRPAFNVRQRLVWQPILVRRSV